MDEVRTIISAITNSALGIDTFDKFGIVPDELKVARVIPIFKKEDEQLVQNYRPISVLPFFSKFFEKIVATCVIDFLDENMVFFKR